MSGDFLDGETDSSESVTCEPGTREPGSSEKRMPAAPQIRRSEESSGAGSLPLEEPLQLGKRLREIRLANKLTLEEASRLTGLARSTLSKIENEQISPSFQAVQKLTAGLGIDIPQLFVPLSPGHLANSRRDITRAGEGQPHPTATYEHELLASTLRMKKMVPFKCRVRARSFADFDDWVRHAGEEFLLVLEGSIDVYTEFYEPVRLSEGDSMYYDAAMGHCLVSVSKKDALVLWVTAR